MMTTSVARLTAESSAGKPPKPVSINPTHVVTLEPRAKLAPNLGSQSGGLNLAYQGSSLHLITGERFNVLEDYEVAHERLWPSVSQAPVVAQALGTLKQGQVTGLAEQLESGTIANDQIPDLTEQLDSAPSVPEAPAEPETKNEPVKKAPAKKAAPKAAEKTDEATADEQGED